MKYYIISGEASGDLHGSNLVKAIMNQDKEANIRAWGGDKMMNAGAKVIKNYKELSFMGFYEVLINVRTILKNLSFCKNDIKKFNPDKLILIDYPGFNMRIAKWAKKNGLKTYYYIAPQIWAWKESRIKNIKKYIDTLYVILPFEKKYFETKHNFPVKFLGHPLLDSIKNFKDSFKNNFFEHNNLKKTKEIITILPGSRKQEIKKILSTMLDVVDFFPDYQFVIGAAPNIDNNFYKKFIKAKNVVLIKNQTYELLSNSKAALVTSGTATLEASIFKIPIIVCYKTSYISYFLAKLLVKIKFISLVNLIMDKEVIKELIQSNCIKKNIINELNNILEPKKMSYIKINYEKLISMLGTVGTSERIASDIINKNT